MSVVIGLLRGINVGGHSKLAMDALRELCESLELREAQTYVQSGNVVFQTKESDLARLTKRIEEAIEKRFRFRPDVILRTPAQLKEVVKHNPFPGYAAKEPGKLLVMFLAGEPAKNAKEIVANIRRSHEELKIQGREIYIYFPEGAGKSKLPWATLADKLGTRGTARNWNTVTKLLEMAEEATREA